MVFGVPFFRGAGDDRGWQPVVGTRRKRTEKGDRAISSIVSHTYNLLAGESHTDITIDPSDNSTIPLPTSGYHEPRLLTFFGSFLWSASKRKKTLRPRITSLPCAASTSRFVGQLSLSLQWGGECNEYWPAPSSFVLLFSSSVGLHPFKVRLLPLPTSFALPPPSRRVFFILLDLEDMIKPLPRLALPSWSFFGVPAVGGNFPFSCFLLLLEGR